MHALVAAALLLLPSFSFSSPHRILQSLRFCCMKRQTRESVIYNLIMRIVRVFNDGFLRGVVALEMVVVSEPVQKSTINSSPSAKKVMMLENRQCEVATSFIGFSV